MSVALYDWQKPTADRQLQILNEKGYVLNTSETGTGKTYIGCDTLKRYGTNALIICPLSVRDAWRSVAADFGISDQILSIVTWQKLMGGRTEWYNARKKEWNPNIGLLIVDEVHKGCSGPKTKTTEMLARAKVYRIPALIQSATIADNPEKLRAVGFLLGLHEFNNASFYNWCRRNGCHNSPFHNGLEFPKGPKGKAFMAKLHESMKDQMVRIRTAEVPDFPENMICSNLYTLDKKYEDQMNDIYASMDSSIKEGLDHENPLVQLLRMRQKIELLKMPLLVDLAKDSLEEDKSVAIFVNFKETVYSLQSLFAQEEIKAAILTGDLKQEDRDAAIKAFQDNKVHIFIGTISAGGVGVSLHDVKKERPRVSYITPSYNAVEVIQTLGRIHRAGGTKVIQHFVLIAGTVEEKVHRAILRKQNNITSLNDGLTNEDLQCGGIHKCKD